MTREEQIVEAGIEYTMQNNPVCIGGDNFYEQMKEFNRNKSFEAGAKWADKHPNINSLWHTSDEVPQCNKRLVIHCDEKLEWILIYYSSDDFPWKELVKTYSIIYWTYAKDILPKGDTNSLWHTSDEVPQCNKRLVIHCDEKLEWTPINNTVLYEDSDYPWKELVELFHILHWAYAKDLVPNFNENLS